MRSACVALLVAVGVRPLVHRLALDAIGDRAVEAAEIPEPVDDPDDDRGAHDCTA